LKLAGQLLSCNLEQQLRAQPGGREWNLRHDNS
jgi:hypothetical protein